MPPSGGWFWRWTTMMFGANEAREARTLIIQHMRDCEIDKKEIKDALKIQNDESDDKHTQNITRLAQLEEKLTDVKDKIQSNYTRLMFVVCTGLMAIVGSLIMEIVKYEKPPPVQPSVEVPHLQHPLGTSPTGSVSPMGLILVTALAGIVISPVACI